MEVLQARIDSFKKSKRVKNPLKPSSRVNLKWPHPEEFKANPETLGEAGFYFDPSYDDPDNVTCYICGKELSCWEVDDDPFLIHWTKCAQTCAWASLRCGLLSDVDQYGRFISSDKTRLPTHTSMEKARSETFAAGKGWIHDRGLNHGANSTAMAHAGFVYTPQHAGDDLAMCLYCGTSLSGWDANDDPMEEHRKRASGHSCAFFAELNSGAASRLLTNKPASTSHSKPSSRSTSKIYDVPTKTFDGEIGPESDATTTQMAKTPRKPRSNSRKSSAKTPRSKSKSRSISKNVAEVMEEESKPEPAPRTRSKSVAPSEANENIEENVITHKRSRSRVTKASSEQKDEPRKSSRSKSKPPAEPIVEDETSRKSSRTRLKAKPGYDLELTGATPKPKSKRIVSRSKSTAPVEVSEVESDVLLEEHPVNRKPRTASRSRPKAPVEVSEVESEAQYEDAPVTAKPKHSRTVSSSRSRAPIEISEAESETQFEEQPIVPKPKRSRTVSRSNVKAHVEPSEPESKAEKMQIETPVLAKSKSGHTRTVLRSRSKAESKIDAEPYNLETLPLVTPKPKRATSKSNILVQPVDDEPEIKNATFALKKSSSKLKDQTIPPLEEQFNDDVIMDSYIPPPSSPPPLQKEPAELIELSPLHIAKRVNKTPKAPFAEDEKENSNFRTPDTIEDESWHEKTPATDFSGIAPHSSQSQAKEVARKLKPTSKPSLNTEKQKAKVVEVSSDDEPEIQEKDRKGKAAWPRGKENGVKGQTTAFPLPSHSKTDILLRTEDPPSAGLEKPEQRAGLIDDAALPNTAAGSPQTTVFPLANDTISQNRKDIQMLEPVPAPETPQRRPAQLVVANKDEEKDTERYDILPNGDGLEPIFIPALSRLPFAPLLALSDAELDMTVEEWIRYQMEVEFDKFRRDGERELQRFRKRAEEIRKNIEGL